jgi:D-arginine dehydrogenase
MSATLAADVAIVGAGIAGASLACWLAPHARVVIVERERHPGVHATGRSAAMFIESYGPPQVRALTQASRAFLERPPAGFADVPLLAPRGALVVATETQRASLERHWDLLRAGAPTARRLDAGEAHALVPVLRRDALAGAAYEPDATDIDVDALHQGYLRAARRARATLICDADVTAVERVGPGWELHAGTHRLHAAVLVDAAGAWVDEVARLAGVPPIGIEPRRRTAFTFAAPDGLETARWPLVIGADEDWYLKPDAGQLLGSPANADPVPPHDVQAEEIDVALGIHRIEQATTLTIRRPRRVWAGLRSFVADGELVGGFDDAAPGFFWLAGQGGYGIQTSAAMGEACAALVLGRPLPPWLAECGLTAAMLSPARLRVAGRRQ